MLKSEIRYSSFIYFVNSEHFWDDVTRIVFNVLGLSEVANKHLFLLGAENYNSPRKTADISRRHHWRNDVPEKRVQKFHTDWLVVPRENFALTNRKHYPEVGSDTSSVWNFCSRFSDFVSREHEYMVASRNVGCSLNCCRISFIKSSYFALHLALITPVKHLCAAVTYVSRQQS